MVAIQSALFVLRLLRTGQVTGSLALTAAAVLVFLISTWVHDMSTDGPSDATARISAPSVGSGAGSSGP